MISSISPAARFNRPGARGISSAWRRPSLPVYSLQRIHIHPQRNKFQLRAIDLNTAWAPNAVDAASIAPQLFAASLFPYLVFLFIASKEEVKMPKTTLFGFGFLLVFVGATIPGEREGR